MKLKPVVLDIETGRSRDVYITEDTANLLGVSADDRVTVSAGDIESVGFVSITDTLVDDGEIGLPVEMTDLQGFEAVRVSKLLRPKSVEYIAKKLSGQTLTKDEIHEIMFAISHHYLKESEMAFFMSTIFNPGFSEDELLWATESMASTGDIIKFDDNNVLDKHSIGGIASKGITPILVSIVSALGYTIPNTSSRSITTPAGTSDVLEVVMPIDLSAEKLYEVVRENNGCMVWGGGLNLAPADDILINVEKSLHLQSPQKVIMSILAKKVAMGITDILIDIPYGPEAKVKTSDDADVFARTFEKLASKLSINCHAKTRFVNAIDGYGVGPILEIRDVLSILEQRDDRCKPLEESALQMTAELLELAGYGDGQKSLEDARDSLTSGRALEQFWKIATAQGATTRVESTDLNPGKFSYDIKASRSGRITSISNKSVMDLARTVGSPRFKGAGVYFHKFIGDSVRSGDTILTVYSETKTLLDTAIAKDFVVLDKLVRLD